MSCVSLPAVMATHALLALSTLTLLTTSVPGAPSVVRLFWCNLAYQCCVWFNYAFYKIMDLVFALTDRQIFYFNLYKVFYLPTNIIVHALSCSEWHRKRVSCWDLQPRPCPVCLCALWRGLQLQHNGHLEPGWPQVWTGLLQWDWPAGMPQQRSLSLW